MGENRQGPDPTPGAEDLAARPAAGEGGGSPRAEAPPLKPPAPLIGSTVGHYRILERLGGGGMGVVYKGWDLRLERYAALKFLSPQRSGSDDFKLRFAREARTASRLEHPNICAVFESDETEDGRLYIAMAFCEGESLKRTIERGPLPLPRAIAVAAQVAAGLGAAHDRGVVHRDVKPGNIMVAADGRVKIVDFGIARLADETRLTRTGDVLGTTAYISPEQFLATETDHRADLWALGVVLYEMVTGRLPWNGGDEREMVNAIVKRAPRPLSSLRPGVPQALERVVGRAMAKRPAERYQRADELRADLLAVGELVAQPATGRPYEQTVIEAPLPPARERAPTRPSGRGEAAGGPPAAAAEERAVGPWPGGPDALDATPARAPARSEARAAGFGAGVPPGSGAAPGAPGTGDLYGKAQPSPPAAGAEAAEASGEITDDRSGLGRGGGAADSARARGGGGTGGLAASGLAASSEAAASRGAASRGGAAASASAASGWAASGSAATPERRPGGGMLGRVVSHYRILSPLGGGGMGVVYKAQDLSLERIVALKFLPPELTRDFEAKSRFLQEARAASALDHPNICTIHEVGETDEGQLFLAMACYDGETLKQRLQRGRLPIEDALETAQQVARGLVKAHRHGIVHRDIKPANLMISSDEIVKILDFGIAKLAGAAGLTRVGSSLGTPGYMSPEQARGEEVDSRTDVWSLGAVLYEMVTGRRPFRGEHEQTVLYSLFNEEPAPVEQLRPEAPPELARIIGRMLAKDPERRYPTAAAALADLRALYGPATGTASLTGQATGTTSLPPALAETAGPRRRRLAAALAVALLVAASAGAYLLLRSRQGSGAAPQQAHYHRITDFEGKETFPSLSPDGTFFVYAKADGGRSKLFLQRVGGGNPIDLTKDSPFDDTQPAYSPDGQQIAFRSERDGGGIFLMGATGESVRRLTDFSCYNPTWSPDGNEIACAQDNIANPVRRVLLPSKLWRVQVAGGKASVVFAGDAVQPAWSPHGARIAYWSVTPGTAQRSLWTIPAAGGAPERVTDDSHLNWSPAWSSDGTFLYFSSDRSGPLNIWRVPIDEASGKVLGPAEPLTTPSPSSGLMSFSRDGRSMIYASDESRSNLEKLPFDPSLGRVTATERTQVTHGSHEVRFGSVSPDGKWIAYDTSAPQEDVFVVHPDGTGERQLTNDAWKNRVPTWLGDGSRVIFYSNRSGKYEAWSIRPDGSGLEKLTSVPDQPVYEITSSPDGKRLACNLGISGAAFFDLAVPLQRRIPWVIPRPPDARVVFNATSWSKDGARLAGTDGTRRIVLYSIDRHTFHEFPQRGLFPIWLSDGLRLLYLDLADGGVRLLNTATSKDYELLRPPPSAAFKALGMSPDDQTLYVVSASEQGDIWIRTVG
jgi:eukaryotic-like serine/threonine-protein kinase